MNITASYTHALGDRTYNYFTVEAGKHTLTITVCQKGEAIDYVNVLVNNASHKAWGGGCGIGGKRFVSPQSAIEGYKTPAVKEAIASVCQAFTMPITTEFQA